MEKVYIISIYYEDTWRTLKKIYMYMYNSQIPYIVWNGTMYAVWLGLIFYISLYM